MTVNQSIKMAEIIVITISNDFFNSHSMVMLGSGLGTGGYLFTNLAGLTCFSGRTAFGLQACAHYLPQSQNAIHLYSDRKIPLWLSRLADQIPLFSLNAAYRAASFVFISLIPVFFF